ncbi:Uncharacterized protein TCM_034075 [Theobroma cacao]|uniref:Uncharacterized protein n=1 Tax=Theobroma cacao TaxID=3641 RepID=A0A061FDM8_THECC|nr:Uncharacterized protein TCM_034075 [Theobroma cacao]
MWKLEIIIKKEKDVPNMVLLPGILSLPKCHDKELLNVCFIQKYQDHVQNQLLPRMENSPTRYSFNPGGGLGLRPG